MNRVQNAAPTEQPMPPEYDDDLPPGDHPLEVAARDGIGPLSPIGRKVWHGNAIPCVTCGQLVLRDQTECHHCQQDLSPEMIAKMRAHAGPWYVLEHVRPFPGVTLERIVKQIRRGLLTETSIVRGPATDYQWRFVVETPGLCRYFGRCWNCHEAVSPADNCCLNCHSSLALNQGRPKVRTPRNEASEPTRPPEQVGKAAPVASPSSVSSTAMPSAAQSSGGARPAAVSPPVRFNVPEDPPWPPPTPELEALSAALGGVELPARKRGWERPPRLGRIPAWFVAVVLMTVVMTGLVFVSQCRNHDTIAPPPATPGMVDSRSDAAGH